MSGTLWHSILSNSLRASALIGCILLLRTIAGRRLPPQCFHLLWILAVARLLLPFAPESKWSVFNLGSHPATAQPAAEVAWQVRTEPGTSIAAAGTPEPAPKVAMQNAAPAISWLALLWIAGIGVQSVLLARSASRLRRRLKNATAINEPAFTSLALGCALKMGLKSAPRIFETDAVPGPAVVGLWRPRLLLPIGLKDRLSEQELRFVLLHECAHLRRADLPALWLLMTARVLHWFNPLVWIAVRLAKVDVELACDQTVLRKTGAPLAYGQTLLKLAQSVAGRGLPLPIIGIVQSKRSIRARLTRIGLYSPSSWVSWLPVLLILALAGLGFGSDEKTPAVVPIVAEKITAQAENKTGWERGWSIVKIEIPEEAKLADAYVTFKTPAGRLVKLARGITSKEGVSIDSIAWTNDPLEAVVTARIKDAAAKFSLQADLVSSTESLKPKSTQIEIESKFIEISDADAKALRIPNPAPNTVHLAPGTPAFGSANVLYAGSENKFLASLNLKEGTDSLSAPRGTTKLGLAEQIDRMIFKGGIDILSAPRVTTKSGQMAVIEIIREIRYPSEYKANPDPAGPKWIPAQYEVRNAGVTLEAEPVLDEDDIIQLHVSPQFVELQGYTDIDTGKVVAAATPAPSSLLSDRAGNVSGFVAAPGQRTKPVFSARKITASVSLRTGQSVIFVGLPETEAIAPFRPAYAGKTLIVVITARLINPNGTEVLPANARK